MLRNFRPSPDRFCAQAVAIAGVFAPAYGVAVDNTGGVEIALHVVLPFGERTQFGGDDHASRGGPGLQSKRLSLLHHTKQQQEQSQPGGKSDEQGVLGVGKMRGKPFGDFGNAIFENKLLTPLDSPSEFRYDKDAPGRSGDRGSASSELRKVRTPESATSGNTRGGVTRRIGPQKHTALPELAG